MLTYNTHIIGKEVFMLTYNTHIIGKEVYMLTYIHIL